MNRKTNYTYNTNNVCYKIDSFKVINPNNIKQELSNIVNPSLVYHNLLYWSRNRTKISVIKELGLVKYRAT